MAKRRERKHVDQASSSRDERLKAALKANLAKRKSQMRARADSERRKE